MKKLAFAAVSFALYSMYNERMKIFALDDGKSGLAIREER